MQALRRLWQLFTLALLACTLAFGTVACDAAPLRDAHPQADHTGPWAERFAEMGRDFPSEFAGTVFSDGEISDSEYAEARQIVENCFETIGLTPTWDSYGRLSVEAEEGSTEPHEALAECSFADGGVMVLHDEMRINPQNLDDMEIRSRCLVSSGVVDPGFSAQDLEAAYERETLPWQQGDEAAERCLVDPLGRGASAHSGTE